MKVGIPKEIAEGEQRVAATPGTVKKLMKLGFDVLVETGAGAGASFPDELYAEAGATVVGTAPELWNDSDIVLKVRPPLLVADEALRTSAKVEREVDLVREGGTLICFVWPAKNKELLDRLAERKVTLLAMDMIPRISRAQKMDALSSMANIAGYRAVIEAASEFGRFFTGQITAAGKVPPAKVLVIGAGVAGLAAIGAAQSLGAIVRAFDTRPVVKEQVESMGAEFLELQFEEDGTGEGGYAKVMSKEFIDAEMALFMEQAKDVDIIVTTALIPGKKAPVLITRAMVEAMRPGSVVVDLAAEAGGNCECTQPGALAEENGVKIIGYTDLPSRLAPTASQLYGTNLCHLLSDMGGAEEYRVDLEDDVVRGALVLHDGELTWPPPKPKVQPEPPKKAEPAPIVAAPEEKPDHSGRNAAVALVAIAAVLGLLGLVAPPSFLSHLTVFVLACFVGWQVIWNVSPSLHTPLMSVTNAISGIIIVGGMLQVAGPLTSPVTILGALAILLAMINISGGFLVTQRMLKMFQR